MLSELPLYKELNVVKANHAFKGYAMSRKVQIIEKKIQLNSEKQVYQVFKGLFSDLTSQTKGFKYQVTLKVIRKFRPNGEIEFRPVYFN